MTDRFLREREVRSMTGLSRTTLWRLERVAEFPRRRQISPGAVGWLESEVLARTRVSAGADADAFLAETRARLPGQIRARTSLHPM